MEPLNEQSKQFIKNNLHKNAESLLLQKQSINDQPIKILAEQILARQKIKEKLPSWYSNLDLLFPKSISLEQSSSELTAKFKSQLIYGNLLIDLTGGLGVDFCAMSQNFERSIYLEQNQELKEIAAYNLNKLAVKNAEFISENSILFIENFNGKADWIYLDPARRNKAGNKVSFLSDCEPNILDIKELLFTKSENILLKCSPMLDIDLAIKQLVSVKTVYIIAIENEIKELIFALNNNYNGQIETKTIVFKKENYTELVFNLSIEKHLEYQIGPIQKYLYEPHVAIMKAGIFKTISKKYNCEKLNPNTHLYTSNKLIEDFPGRKFEIIDQLKADKKEIKRKIPNLKANLTIRNFPGTVEQIRKKFALKDGGDIYLFATTNNINEKIILQTIKIN